MITIVDDPQTYISPVSGMPFFLPILVGIHARRIAIGVVLVHRLQTHPVILCCRIQPITIADNSKICPIYSSRAYTEAGLPHVCDIELPCVNVQ